MIVGLITGFIAAIPGLIDFMSMHRARSIGPAWGHALGNIVALVITFANLRIRIADLPR